MTIARAANWEEELLTNGLSERAKRAGVAYTGPGSGNDVPQVARPPIAFTGGIPDPAYLPIEDLVTASERVLREEGTVALQYGGAQGFQGLRDWLADHWTRIDGLPLTAANYTLTNGSAHALENVCNTFLREGEIVIVEAPSFPGSIRAIRAMGVDIESVPVDGDGLIVEALEELVRDLDRRGRRAKMLYTIPNYHNPTGSTLSVERRHRLLDLCERHDILIVEDDAYGEIGFEERLPQSLYSMSQGRGVIKIGTFSKILATGLRVGWCQATQPVIDALIATRFDMGISPFVIRTINRYAADGRLDDHIAQMRALYERKRDVMLNELRERCSSFARWTDPRGGFFLWMKLSEQIDPVALAAYAREEGVAFVGGRGFFADLTAGEAPTRFWSQGHSDHIRLAYSYTAEQDIPEGIRRLARAMERARR
ncbi:MAG TPA: PLP-dependent aminotransferase family protein [Dehalococcoidia bacterium]|nr:PLP-dependent aminotransferase family protein [Dehalococcoidia bacterium]